MSIAPDFVIEQPIGSLAIHDLTVGVAREGASVVVAVHGITANGLSWRRVADEVDRRHGPGAVRFLAPDLRGRGGSRRVPGPHGLAAHVEDPSSIASIFAAAPLLVGHSMGGFISPLAWPPTRSGSRECWWMGTGHPSPGGSRHRCGADGGHRSGHGPPRDAVRQCRGLPRLLGRPSEFSRACAVPLARRSGSTSPTTWCRTCRRPWRSSCELEAVRADGADILADPVTHGAMRRAVELGKPIDLVGRVDCSTSPQAL